MRIFISYKYTNVPKDQLGRTVNVLIEEIRKKKHDVFCNLEFDGTYQNEKWTNKEIMEHCFMALDKCNYHITFVAPKTLIGEGMMIELGYAIKMKLPTLLLLPTTYSSVSAKAVVDNTIVYTNMDDLLCKLNEYMEKL